MLHTAETSPTVFHLRVSITTAHYHRGDFMGDQVHTVQRRNLNYKINRRQKRKFKQLEMLFYIP